MGNLIELKNIKKSYDNRKNVLRGVDFSLRAGEIATIFGESGCGKSTLLNIIGLLDNFSKGSYVFNGVPVEREKLNTYHKQRARDIGFVFQAYCLIEALSVEENILMPFLYNNLHVTDTVFNRLNTVLEVFNIAQAKGKRVSLLSGGERQRVAIARAIMKHPKLIIADEPTGNLDDKNARIIIKAFQDVASHGTAVIVVTHNKSLTFHTEKQYTLDGGVLFPC
jgi:ABC-type lipoprotein export system ATPase subunit